MIVLFALWFLTLILYVIFSFGLTDPNLVLFTWPPYQTFQQWAWQTFFLNRPVLAFVYVAFIVFFFVLYGMIMRRVRAGTLTFSSVIVVTIATACILSLSYNSLSHDLFNYIFNARMIVEYGANPHITNALSFPNDDWTRFMHNTHTTAPYGYGWTALSVGVYLLGAGKFFITWMMFKGLGLLSYLLLIWMFVRFFKIEKSGRFWLAALVLNPLVLIEVLSNSHNDLWMLLPAVVSIGLLVRSRLTKKLLVISGALLLLSVSVKFATVLLLPVWLMLTLKGTQIFSSLPGLVQKNIGYWPELSSILLFLPLLTERSQYFHPWYLLWSLVWLPLMRWRVWKVFLLALSASSLLRYLPWLLDGGFSPDVLLQQRLMTWVPAALVTIAVYTFKRSRV
jgi:hypothetical protein